MDADRFFRTLASHSAGDRPRASARLKSKIYSALVRRQASTGRLLPLSATKAAGHPLCVFEEILCGIAVDDRLDSANPCRVCHARVLGEQLEAAPIFWPHCPYVEFRRR